VQLPIEASFSSQGWGSGNAQEKSHKQWGLDHDDDGRGRDIGPGHCFCSACSGTGKPIRRRHPTADLAGWILRSMSSPKANAASTDPKITLPMMRRMQ